MPHIRVRDIDMYYEIHGTGPRLVFIGGSGGDLRDKPGVFDGPLVDHFEVLSFDQRGLGRSDVPDGPYSMEDYAEDVAALMDALDFTSCPVMGVSFGGMVALELVCRYPEKVSKLVLACTSAGGEAGASYPLHTLEDLEPQERAALLLGISDTRFGAEWREANPEVAEKLIELSMSRGQPRSEDIARGQHWQLEARSHHDTAARIKHVTIPTYICAGKYDGLAPPKNQLSLLAAFPNATLDYFEGGHLFLMQDRSALEAIIENLSA